MKKCINIDWLEVFCSEPMGVELNAQWYKSKGFKVNERAYGTPQYKEMFTLLQQDSPRYEIRRSPYSVKKEGGLFDSSSCHIRLVNRECYRQDPIGNLRDFLIRFGYTLKGISRVDICLDVDKLSDGTDVGKFIYDYILEKYYKIHLSRITPQGVECNGANFQAHGTDTMYSRKYTSIKWGSPTSKISVKIYDKTKELYEVKDKFYIRDCWLASGLVDKGQFQIMADIRDCNYNIATINAKLPHAKDKTRLKETRANYARQLAELKSKVKHIWRFEFSLSSGVKGLFKADEDDKVKFYPITLSTIDTKERQLFLFNVLAAKYLHFKIPSITKSGKPERKDRCKDYFPILPDKGEQGYSVPRMTEQKEPSRTDRIVINNLRRLVDYNNENGKFSHEFINHVIQIIRYYQGQFRMDELKKAMDNLLLNIADGQEYNQKAEQEGKKLIDKILKWKSENSIM